MPRLTDYVNEQILQAPERTTLQEASGFAAGAGRIRLIARSSYRPVPCVWRYNRAVSEDRAMNGAPERIRMTYDDLLALPDDGLRHELIDGEHIVSPSPGSAHQLIVGNLYLLLRQFLREHHIGVAMLAPFDIVFSRFDVVEPDLIYFTMDRFRAIVGEKNAQGPPDLAVEILSPWSRRRDEITKRCLYERWGVGEYWVVDPDIDTMKVYRLAGGKFDKATELSAEAGDSLTTPLLPGLSLPLSSIFELP